MNCLQFNWYLVLIVLFNIMSIYSQTNSDPFKINQGLGCGINLGNALEAPNEGEWGVMLEERYFQIISQGGFESVRIPIRWSAHALSSAPYTIDERFFQKVDWAIEMSRKYQLYGIINMHHYEEINTDPYGHKERFLKLWEQISDRYQDCSDSLVFEVLNEPHDDFTAEIWNEFLAEAIEVIRVKNSNRTIMIGTAGWGGISALNDLLIPEGEDNVIVTFHYYNPFEFTHQGAEWVSGSDAWLNTTWSATYQQRIAIAQDFDRVYLWAQQANRPIYLGEFGAYSKADMDSRALWTEYCARYAEKRNFSWGYWEFCSGFGVYDTQYNDWRYPLLYALQPGAVGIDESEESRQPDQLILVKNYSNPFNPSTMVEYELPEASNVTLTLMDASGRIIEVIKHEVRQQKGVYRFEYDAGMRSSGVYFIVLRTDFGQFVKKIQLIK